MTTAQRELPAREDASAPVRDPHRRGYRDVPAALQRLRSRLFGLDERRAAGRPGTTAYVLAALVVLVHPLHKLLVRQEPLLGGAMWAEMATNYYAVSLESSLLDRLFTTDAGYIPLPQRLIAILGAELGLHPGVVAHLYAGAALLLGAGLVATICLPVFRPVVGSDGIRFVLALALLLAPDYEVRTFINVTYFAVVPAVAVAALAAVQRDRQVPAWAWVLPLFMLSKPGVLAVLPAMVVVALVSRSRFRWITGVASVAGLVQVVQLVVSSASGSSLLQQTDQSALSKLFTAGKFASAFPGRLLLGPGVMLGNLVWLVLGLVVLLLSLAAVLRLRSRAAPLVLIGFSLIGFTMLVNAVTFSAAFTRDLALLSHPVLDRRFVVAVFGALFVMAGLVAMLVESPRRPAFLDRPLRPGTVPAASVLGPALLAGWLVGTGWLHYAVLVNRPSQVPLAHVSQWQRMSPVLAGDEPVVCVPLDPFGWVYGRNCIALASTGVPVQPAWTRPDRTAGGWAVEVTVPAHVSDAHLASVGLLVRPLTGPGTVVGRAVVTDAYGRQTVLDGEADLPATGGVVQFVDSPTPLVRDARTVRFVFAEDVEVALRDVGDPDTAVSLWMGRPAGG